MMLLDFSESKIKINKKNTILINLSIFMNLKIINLNY